MKKKASKESLMKEFLGLLKSVKFWTIVGAVATFIATAIVICEKIISKDYQIDIMLGDYQINDAKQIDLYYICPKEAGLEKYEFPFPVGVANRNDYQIKEFEAWMKTQMLELNLNNTRAYMYRIISRKDSIDLSSGKQYANIPLQNIRSGSSLHFDNLKLNAVTSDSYFDINLSLNALINQEGKDFHKEIRFRIYVYIVDNPNAMFEIIKKDKKRNDERFAVYLEKENIGINDEKRLIFIAKLRQESPIIKL